MQSGNSARITNTLGTVQVRAAFGRGRVCDKEAWHLLNVMLSGEGIEIRSFIRRARFSPAFRSLYDTLAGQMVLKASTSIACAHIKALIHLQSRGRGHTTTKNYALHVKWKRFRIPGYLEDSLCFF